MSPALARPLLHTVHLVTFAVLLGSGILLLLPGLRAVITGGYSLLIRESHRWGGVAFVILPALIIFRCGVRRVFAPRSPRTLRTVWQGIHVAITILIGTVLALTGFVLWGKRLLPELLVESSLITHDWLTYVVATLFAMHLLDMGAVALLTRIQTAMATAANGSET